MGKGSDHLQLINFWPSRAPGRGLRRGEIFWLPPYYSQRAVFASLSAFYRQDAAKRQTAGIKFMHRPKIRLFAPQGLLVAPIHVKLGRADGHVGTLGCAKFHLNRRREVGMRPPKYQKFPLFGKESDSLDRFRKFLGAFIHLTILHQFFKFHMIRITGYGVIAEKPCVGKLGQIFPCTL